MFGNIRKLQNWNPHFEQQRVINKVWQWVFQEALQGALRTLNSWLNSDLHFCTMIANIGILWAMEEITD